MPRRLAKQQMTLSDVEWPFHASRAISAVAWASCFMLHYQWWQLETVLFSARCVR